MKNAFFYIKVGMPTSNEFYPQRHYRGNTIIAWQKKSRKNKVHSEVTKGVFPDTEKVEYDSYEPKLR